MRKKRNPETRRTAERFAGSSKADQRRPQKTKLSLLW